MNSAKNYNAGLGVTSDIERQIQAKQSEISAAQKQNAQSSMDKSLEAAKKVNAGLGTIMGIQQSMGSSSSSSSGSGGGSAYSGSSSGGGGSSGGSSQKTTYQSGSQTPTGKTSADERMEALYNAGQLGLMERTLFLEKILPSLKLKRENAKNIELEKTVNELYNLNGKTLTVVNDGGKPNKVAVNLSKDEMEAIVKMTNVHKFDPTLIIAIIAHESRFMPNEVSHLGAAGYMQVLKENFLHNLNYNQDVKSIAYSYAGNDINNEFNPFGNLAAGINQLADWRDKQGYGEEDMLKCLRQGNKGAGWSKNAIRNEKEFLDIKTQLDTLLEEN